MQEDGPIKISQTINKEVTIGNFSMDELMPLFIAIGFSLFTNQPIWIVVILCGIAIYAGLFYKKLKETKVRNFIFHFSYWYGIGQVNKNIPPAHITFYQGG